MSICSCMPEKIVDVCISIESTCSKDGKCWAKNCLQLVVSWQTYSYLHAVEGKGKGGFSESPISTVIESPPDAKLSWPSLVPWSNLRDFYGIYKNYTYTFKLCMYSAN